MLASDVIIICFVFVHRLRYKLFDKRIKPWELPLPFLKEKKTPWRFLLGWTGHEIAPNTVANATKIIVLATKIQKLVAKLATRTLWVLYILPWCFFKLNKA